MSKVPTKYKHSFIDYYNAHGIIPVRDMSSDTQSFNFRRNYLYKTLGIPLNQLKNRKVIEFGPGGGFNAVATSNFEPELYVFVDATHVSLTELKHKSEQKKFGAKKVEIIESNIFDYRDERKYDLVICEGILPGQDNPKKMLQHVGSFCDSGGILITTTMSATSQFSEICRRLLRPSIIASNQTFLEQTKIAVDLFKNHIDTLGVSTRSPEDWVQDVILHNWHTGEYIFTMPDSLAALGDDFEFYSSSPRFLHDGRWYKQISPASASINMLLNDQYAAFNALLLDFRIPLDSLNQRNDIAKIAMIDPLCEAACKVHDKISEENSYDRLEEFIAILNKVTAILPQEFDITVRSINDFISGISSFASGNTNADFGSFKQWWGRGQQYISYIKT